MNRRPGCKGLRVPPLQRRDGNCLILRRQIDFLIQIGYTIKNRNKDTQCRTGSMSTGQRCPGKRESGARPERSGHCERGERLQGPLCQRHEKAQPIDNPRVRKPAETIRCTASEESGSPEKPVLALFTYARRLLT